MAASSKAAASAFCNDDGLLLATGNREEGEGEEEEKDEEDESGLPEPSDNVPTAVLAGLFPEEPDSPQNHARIHGWYRKSPVCTYTGPRGARNFDTVETVEVEEEEDLCSSLVRERGRERGGNGGSSNTNNTAPGQ